MKKILVIIFAIIWASSLHAQVNAINYTSTDEGCDPISSLPWIENFDSIVDGEAEFDCWNFLGNDIEFANANVGRISIYTHLPYEHQAVTKYMVLPEFQTQLNALQLNFRIYHGGGTTQQIVVGYMTDPSDSTTFVEAFSRTPYSEGYFNYQFRFYALPDSAAGHFAVGHRALYWNSSGYFDDFVVDSIIPCTKPNNPTITGMVTDMTVTWTDPNPNNELWNLYYREAGSDEPFICDTGVTSPVTINNLDYYTLYQVFVTTNCGGEESVTSDTISYRTPCGGSDPAPTALEEFSSGLPPCWIRRHGTLPNSGNVTFTTQGTYWSQRDNNVGGNISGKHAVHNVFRNIERDWLITTPIDLGNDRQVYTIEFDVQLTDFASVEAPNLDNIDDRFAVVISTDSGATWNVENAIIWDNYSDGARYYNNFAEQQHIVIPTENNSGEPYQGVIQIGFYHESTITNADNDLHIDNFIVKRLCIAPANVSVSEIDHYSATISWEDELFSEWEIRLVGDETDTIINASDTAFTFSQLIPATEYRVYVRSHCYEGEYTTWDSISFTTAVNPCVPPVYIATFSESPTSLLVTWSGNGEHYAIRYRVLGEESWNTIDEVNAPYIIENLESNTIYEVQVQGNCATAISDWAPEIPFMGITQPIVSIAENKLHQIQLYPNPAYDVISIINHNIEMKKIEVIDLSGRVILQPNVYQKNINIQQLESGIYFIKIMNDHGTVTLRFVKQ